MDSKCFTSTKVLAYVIIFIGIILILIGIIIPKSCDKKPIKYRKTPRTFKEEQKNPVKVSEIFKDMFL